MSSEARPQSVTLLDFDNDTERAVEAIVLQCERRTGKAHLPAPAHLATSLTGNQLTALCEEMTQKNVSGGAASQPPPSTDKLSVGGARLPSAPIQVDGLTAWTAKIQHGQEKAAAAGTELEALKHEVEHLMQTTEAVKSRNDALSSDASALMVRKAYLERTLSGVQSTLQRYTRIDDLSAEVSHPMLVPASSRFASILEDLQNASEFLSKCPQYKSTRTYASKLAMAQQRALMRLRDAIVNGFAAIVNDVTSNTAYYNCFHNPQRFIPHIRHDPGHTGERGSQVVIDDLATAVTAVNGIFHQLCAGGMLPLLRMLESCEQSGDEAFIEDAIAAYSDARSRLTSPLIADSLEHMSNTNTKEDQAGTKLRQLASDVTTTILAVVRQEILLNENVWLVEETRKSVRSIVESYNESFYNFLRAKLLDVDEIEDLCLVADGFNTILESVKGKLPRGNKSNHHLRENSDEAQDTPGEVSAPTSFVAEELVLPVFQRLSQDTQERIVFRTSNYVRGKLQRFPFSAVDVWACCQPSLAKEQPQSTTDGSQPSNASTTPVPLFPPLDNCISLLDMLYTMVDRNVFCVFAEESVRLTVQSLVRAYGLLANSAGGVPAVASSSAASEPRSNPRLHGALFLVKHLLLLREHVARFDVDLASVEKDVDLSLLVQRRLEIRSRPHDAKHEVEANLKAACETVIRSLVDIICASAGETAITIANNTVQEAIKPLLAHMTTQIARWEAVVAFYVTSESTRAVLLRPVRGQVAELVRSRVLQAAPDYALQEGEMRCITGLPSAPSTPLP